MRKRQKLPRTTANELAQIGAEVLKPKRRLDVIVAHDGDVAFGILYLVIAGDERREHHAEDFVFWYPIGATGIITGTADAIPVIVEFGDNQHSLIPQPMADGVLW